MGQNNLNVWKQQNVWWMSYGTQSGGPGSYPQVTVPNGTNANFKYTIINTPGVTFGSDPIWIQAGTTKPTQPGVDGHFNVPPGQNGTTLNFHDNNKGNGETLSYVLRFSDGTTLDPIINNGGGGPGYNWNMAYYALGAVALIVLAILVLKPVFRKPGPVE